MQRLGKALKTLPRDKIILATKCGRYPTHFNFDGDYVTKTVKESMERLQVDYLDVIQIHDIEFGDLDQVSSFSLRCMTSMQMSSLHSTFTEGQGHFLQLSAAKPGCSMIAYQAFFAHHFPDVCLGPF